MKTRRLSRQAPIFAGLVFAALCDSPVANAEPGNVDEELRAALARENFTGRVESTLEQRLGRRLDPAKAELGRALFFDKFVGLHGDNSCAGCHSPLNGSVTHNQSRSASRTTILSGPAAPDRAISAAPLRS
jgi:cytochrome c peroxidase